MSVITNSIGDTKIIFWSIVSPVFRLLRLPHRRIFQTAPWRNVCLQKRRSVFLCRVAHSSLTKATTSRPFTIWSEMFIMGIVSFRWISEILNPWKSCRPVIRSVKPVLLWTRTVYFRIMDVPVRNTAVRSRSSVCPCSHKNWNNGKKNRGCTKYVTLPDDYRLSIDWECVTFKKVYAMRTEIERYNSRFKSTVQERLWVHSFYTAQNLNSLAHIAMLSVAIAATVTRSECSYRCLKSAKRLA